MRSPETPGFQCGPTHGFSLFEVLGAVALLAIVYTVLATAAIRGLRTEGQSRRILEASLIADLEIANIEMDLDRGGMPGLGVDEFESDDEIYRIRIEVSVFEMPPLDEAAKSAFGSGSLGQANTAPSFATTGDSPLREIVVQVAWGNPDNERFVERVTYGIDPLAVEIAAGASSSALEGRR